MIDTEKQAFWKMVNVCMELYRSPALSKEAVTVWWAKLEKFEFHIVSKAFDKWVGENKRQPTPADIIDLCKSHKAHPEFVALGRKFTAQEKAANKARLDDVLRQLNIKRIGT